LNKSKPKELQEKIIIIDASNEYKQGSNQNELLPTHVAKIINAYDSMQDMAKFMRVVDVKEIEGNDYNLNISRYIDTADEEELIDLKVVQSRIQALQEREKEIDEQLAIYLNELGI
jgi:type I restriction enzyme M protein